MIQYKSRVHLKVGVFLFFGFFALLTYILLIGGKRTYLQRVSRYHIQFNKVDGLFRGSVVTLNGVSAGNVTNIHFNPETGLIKVSISVLKKFAPAITESTTASLGTKGILGDKYIQLDTKGMKGKVLPQQAYITNAKATGFMGDLGLSVENKVPIILDEIPLILNEINFFFKTLNAEKTIQKINKTSQNASTFFSKEKSREIKQILKKLKSILSKIDEGEGTLGALINDKNIYNRILSLLGQKPYHRYLPHLVEEVPKRQKK